MIPLIINVNSIDLNSKNIYEFQLRKAAKIKIHFRRRTKIVH